MRKGRGIDHNWEVRKYKGDGAYYACCRCGWYYACGSIIDRQKPEEWKMYPYCPSCGAHKKRYNIKPQKMEKSFPFE